MVESKVTSQLIQEFKNKSTPIFQSKFKNFAQIQGRFISDNAATRFLIANNNQLDSALDQWTKATEWHVQYRPDLIDLNDESVKIGLDVKHLHLFNYDKQNNSVIYALQKNTQKGRFKPDQEFRWLLYLIEEGIRMAEKRGASKFTAIIDRRGLKFSQIDKNSIKSWQKLFQTLSLAYPERLSQAYIIGADWLFNLLYSIMKPFMNKDTIKKIKLLNKPEDLQRYIDKAQLLDLYGGLFKYPYDNKQVSMGLIPEKDQAEILKEMSADLGYEIDLSNLEELQKQSNIDVNEID